jgi:UDP-glucose 4-epimerase
MKGSRCLITGGAGLVGSHIADQLIAAGAEVLILDNFSGGNKNNIPSGAQLYWGDIRDKKLVKELVQGVDYVFHQAAIKIQQCAADPYEAIDVIANGTLNIFQAAANRATRVVAASSSSIYGLADEFPTNEKHHSYNDTTLYGAGKAFTEGIARSLELNCVMLRYFSVYGPRVDVSGMYTEVLPRWMDRISAGLPPLIEGDGTATRDFVYVGDVAKANIRAAQSDVIGAFNIASGIETTLTDLAEMLLGVMGSDLIPQYGPVRKIDPCPRKKADISLAKKQFGWEPQVDLETGLKKLVSWRYQ